MRNHSSSIEDYAALLGWSPQIRCLPLLRPGRVGKRGGWSLFSARATVGRTPSASRSSPPSIVDGRGPSRSERVMEALARVVNLGSIRLW